MKIKLGKPVLPLVSVCILSFSAYANLPQKEGRAADLNKHETTLNALIEAAIHEDSRRKQIQSQALSTRELGISSSTLPDPKLKLGVGGLPADSFKFDEDPMTNISVGIMQQFERGSTLALNLKKSEQQAEILSLQVNAREIEIKNSLTKLWLEIGYLQKAENTLRENIALMQELESFVQSNYSLGKSETQDLLSAQLQVSKLEEKLQANTQSQQRLAAQMSEWIGAKWINHAKIIKTSNHLQWDELEAKLSHHTSSSHFELLNQNPWVQMASVGVKVSQTQVEISEQSYKPQIGVEVMYGYRQANNMAGEPAPDLVSAYVTLDIPLFTDNRQDKALSAAQYQVGSARFNKDTLLLQLNAKVNELMVTRSNLKQRLVRYNNTLLPQSASKIKAIERGYQNNTATFDAVIAATADDLALQLEKQRLVTDLNIANSNLTAIVVHPTLLTTAHGNVVQEGKVK